MDLIDRQAAIKAIGHRLVEPAYQHTGEDWYVGMNCAASEIYELPSAQHEITEEEVKEYCRKRCLCIVDSALLKKYASAQPEIIRCKDCKHYDDGLCRRWKYSHVTSEESFCSRAERWMKC